MNLFLESRKRDQEPACLERLPDTSADVFAPTFAALLDHGIWEARPKDCLGILFTYVGVSDRLAAVQGIERSLGLPLSNKATGVQSHEMLLEVNYDIHVFRGVHFQPDFQYVFRPNAQANIRDAARLRLPSACRVLILGFQHPRGPDR